jgi:anti-sigma B factor antagonist
MSATTTFAPVPSGEPFRVDVLPERDVVRVVPIGELDLATVPELAGQLQELRDVGFQRLVLDLRRLEFIDSTGLHLIVKLDRDARREGHEFAVIPGPPAVQRLFDLTGVAEHVHLHSPASPSELDGQPASEPTCDQHGSPHHQPGTIIIRVSGGSSPSSGIAAMPLPKQI